MFKRGSSEEKNKTADSTNRKFTNSDLTGEVVKDVPVHPSRTAAVPNVNKILKGSKLLGDITVICDLEVSGDVDGNITSMQDSDILIKGVCKGNIETKGGSVNIEGELQGGSITAGKDVNISGKFNGGEVKAAGKIFVDGEFTGRLEGNDVEIGANSNGKGEVFYREFISISRGAKVEVQISQASPALKEVKTPPKAKEEPPKENLKPVQQSFESNKSGT